MLNYLSLTGMGETGPILRATFGVATRWLRATHDVAMTANKRGALVSGLGAAILPFAKVNPT
jgi:hypothetical protein